MQIDQRADAALHLEDGGCLRARQHPIDDGYTLNPQLSGSFSSARERLIRFFACSSVSEPKFCAYSLINAYFWSPSLVMSALNWSYIGQNFVAPHQSGSNSPLSAAFSVTGGPDVIAGCPPRSQSACLASQLAGQGRSGNTDSPCAMNSRGRRCGPRPQTRCFRSGCPAPFSNAGAASWMLSIV